MFEIWKLQEDNSELMEKIVCSIQLSAVFCSACRPPYINNKWQQFFVHAFHATRVKMPKIFAIWYKKGLKENAPFVIFLSASSSSSKDRQTDHLAVCTHAYVERADGTSEDSDVHALFSSFRS